MTCPPGECHRDEHGTCVLCGDMRDAPAMLVGKKTTTTTTSSPPACGSCGSKIDAAGRCRCFQD